MPTFAKYEWERKGGSIEEWGIESKLLRKGEGQMLRWFICEEIWSDHDVTIKVGLDFCILDL